MHDISNEINQIDRRVVESPDLLGKECCGCARILAYQFYRRDSSYRDGRRDLCLNCESTPRLSTAEHTARLNELNFNSEAVKAQRWDNQLHYMCNEARYGKQMHSSEFLLRLRKLVGTDRLFLRDGKFIGDISVYQVSGRTRPDFSEYGYRYLWYIPTGWMPEFSIYEFDHRAIPIREHKRGWRTPLIRLIKSGLLTEDECNWEFGYGQGMGSVIWQIELKKVRQKNLKLVQDDVQTL